MFVLNQKVRISDNAPHYAGEIGYFQFDATGRSAGTVVLSYCKTEDRRPPSSYVNTYFTVASNNILPV